MKPTMKPFARVRTCGVEPGAQDVHFEQTCFEQVIASIHTHADEYLLMPHTKASLSPGSEAIMLHRSEDCRD